MLEEQHADAADEEEMFETTHTHMDTPAMTLSAFWPGPQIESRARFAPFGFSRCARCRGRHATWRPCGVR